MIISSVASSYPAPCAKCVYNCRLTGHDVGWTSSTTGWRSSRATTPSTRSGAQSAPRPRSDPATPCQSSFSSSASSSSSSASLLLLFLLLLDLDLLLRHRHRHVLHHHLFRLLYHLLLLLKMISKLCFNTPAAHHYRSVHRSLRSFHILSYKVIPSHILHRPPFRSSCRCRQNGGHSSAQCKQARDPPRFGFDFPLHLGTALSKTHPGSFQERREQGARLRATPRAPSLLSALLSSCLHQPARAPALRPPSCTTRFSRQASMAMAGPAHRRRHCHSKESI